MTDLAPRICPRHETEFQPTRANQVFCSTACKDAAHKEERELGKLLISAGVITRAQLRAFWEVVNAADDPHYPGRAFGRPAPVYGGETARKERPMIPTEQALHAVMESITQATRSQRADYHLTLGEAIERLKGLSGRELVRFDFVDAGPGKTHSYRGYYDDLAFAITADTVIASDFLKACEAALGATFEGYKGGDYVMDEKTPLWAAEWGNLGPAIMDMEVRQDIVMLITKDVR